MMKNYWGKLLGLGLGVGLLISVHAGAQTYSLGTSNLVEGPTAGSDSVVLGATNSWTATTNANWLHLSAANQSGTVSTNVIFTFDANSGTTRTGTLTIAGQTVTITQAGSTYVAVTNTTSLVSSGLSSPRGLAVDGAGNVYIADYTNNAIKMWTATNNTVTTLVSSNSITPLNHPSGVAVDGLGNVYIADTGNNAIKKWTAADSNVTTLASTQPRGVAVDGAGNVYFSDLSTLWIKKWTAANSNISTLVYGGGSPYGVAVDSAGNVYHSDLSVNKVSKWTLANRIDTTLVSVGLLSPQGVAVDGGGNVYIANNQSGFVQKLTVVNGTVTTLASFGFGLNGAGGVAVDGAANVYMTDRSNNSVKALPHAFVDSTTKVEGALAGSDTLPVVVPTTANLSGPFMPTSDSPWLTISGVTNGVVSYAFTANYTNNRTAKITLLGLKIAVTQPAVLPPVLNNCAIQSNGSLRFSFTNNQGATFTVWTATNMMLPFTNWTPLCTLTNNGSGQYDFNDLPGTDSSQRFYRVTAP
ncbi:MAG: BACON domain-containing carbohydrate-binding protein [Verrucomicrobiota bacterium]